MSYENLPHDYKKTFSRYTGLLEIIGIDIFNISRHNKRRLFILNILFVPFIGGQLSLVTKITADNFLEGALIIPILAIAALNVIKLSTALARKKEIKQIFIEIGELWPRDLEAYDEKAVIMRIWMRRMGLLQHVYYIYAVVNLALFEVSPLLLTCLNIYSGADEYLFPLPPGCPWEINSPLTYLITYLWEVLGTMPYQLCLYQPFVLLMMIITSNLSILFRLLQKDLERAVQLHDGNMRQSVSDPESCKIISRIAKDHQKLLRIGDQVRDIFSLVILIHVAFSSIMICFFGFLTVVFSGAAETLTNSLSVWNAVVTIFLLTFSGQLLSDTSSGVADAAYQNLWYESDMKVKKLVLFIIVRSQKASYLSALGFSDITLRTFSKIMSTSWTYFSLLIQMYGEE